MRKSFIQYTCHNLLKRSRLLLFRVIYLYTFHNSHTNWYCTSVKILMIFISVNTDQLQTPVFMHMLSKKWKLILQNSSLVNNILKWKDNMMKEFKLKHTVEQKVTWIYRNDQYINLMNDIMKVYSIQIQVHHYHEH